MWVWSGDGGAPFRLQAFLSNILPKSLTPTYIQSQWSFAQFRLPGSEKALTRVHSPHQRAIRRRVGSVSRELVPLLLLHLESTDYCREQKPLGFHRERFWHSAKHRRVFDGSAYHQRSIDHPMRQSRQFLPGGRIPNFPVGVSSQ